MNEYGLDPYSAELLDLQQRRAMANAQIQKGMEGGPVKHWSQGAARALSLILGQQQAAKIAEEMKGLAGRREEERMGEMAQMRDLLVPGEVAPSVPNDDDGNPMPKVPGAPKSRDELARAMLGMRNPKFQQMGMQRAMQRPAEEEAYTLAEGARRFKGDKLLAENPKAATPEKVAPDPEAVRLARIANDPQRPEFERRAAAAILAKQTREPQGAAGTWALHPSDPTIQIHSTTGEARKVRFPDGVEPKGKQAASLTPAQKAVDQQFGKDYVEWTQGGFSDARKSLVQLGEVSAKLGSSGSISGGLIGNVPRAVRATMGSDSANVQDQVEEVVQRNLRLVLGAQFTEREGQRLIERAYNPRLSEAENKKRVDRLMRQIQSAAEAKDEASRYYEENGTLSGWRGKLWRMDDFDPDRGESTKGTVKAAPAGGGLSPTEQAELAALRKRFGK